jgi:cold shock CspA family protein
LLPKQGVRALFTFSFYSMAGEEQEWHYVDSTGQEFGPFPSSTMRGWFQQGFFPMQGDLLVRLSSWTEHQKIGQLYGDPINETAFDGPPRQVQGAPQASRPAPAPSGGGGRSKQGGGRGGGRGGGNNTGGALELAPQMGYDALMPNAAAFFGGMPGAMMPGAAMQGAGLAPYGFPAVRPGGYSPMSPFGGMPMMAPGPGQTTGRFHGRIKSFNAQKGFGFIECPEAHAIYGRDVFLHKAQIADFQIGSELSFAVEMNKSNMPQARDLSEVDNFSMLAAGAMGMGGLNPFMGGAMGMGGKGPMLSGGGGNKGGGKGRGKPKAKPKGKPASKKGSPPEIPSQGLE